MNKSKQILLVIIVSLLMTVIPYVNTTPDQDPCDTPGQGNTKYWFYIEEPSYSFYDPEAGPNYVGEISDAWVTESVVRSIDWESFAGTETNAEFSFWMVVTNSPSQNTKVVISINNAANEGIIKI